MIKNKKENPALNLQIQQIQALQKELNLLQTRINSISQLLLTPNIKTDVNIPYHSNVKKPLKL